MILIRVGVRILVMEQIQTLMYAKKNAGVERVVLLSTFAMVRIAYSEAAPFPDQHQPGTGLQAGVVQVTMLIEQVR